MQTKLCSECGEPAEVSLCQILSTVGRKKREQRCSTSTPYCAACLQSRVKLLRRLGLHYPSTAWRCVYGVGERLRNSVEPPAPDGSGDAERGRPVVLVELQACLTACNCTQICCKTSPE